MPLLELPMASVEKNLMAAAFHELEAARYLGMNRTAFREMVFSGLLPFRVHLNGKRRIYLRTDLDDYLQSLKRRTMPERENSQPALKGVNE